MNNPRYINALSVNKFIVISAKIKQINSSATVNE